MPSFAAKEKILKYVTDPDKVKRVNTLTDEEAEAVASSYLSDEQAQILDRNSSLLQLRVIYFRRLMDWASTEANEIQAKILEFIDSPTFVQYPDFMKNEAIMAATKTEFMSNHSRSLYELELFETDILGARINDSGDVEVLITYNQVLPASDGYLPYYNFSQEKYSIPPQFTIGLLRRNTAIPMRGQGNEIYISMKAPYSWAHIETIIDQPQKKR